MKILIVEDEPAAVRHLHRLLTQCDNSVLVLKNLDSVEATVRWLQTHEPPDLFFMDIQLADGISFEIFQKIEVATPVIFCTAYDEYAIDAFKANSIDYLLKPLEKKAVCDSLLKFKKLQYQWAKNLADFDELFKQLPHKKAKYCSRLLVKMGKNFVSISCSDIAYIYTKFKIVTLVTLEAKSYTLDHSLDKLDDMLDNAMFFRINRQTIVSINGITSVGSEELRLIVHLAIQNNKPIVVSRDKSNAFKKWLGQ